MPTPRPRSRARKLVLAWVAVASLVTVVGVWLGPQAAYRNLPLKVALETAMALVGVLVAYLAVGRYRRSARARDLLLAQGFALVALANLAFAALPTALGGATGAFATWAPLLGRLTGGLLLCGSALAAPDRLLSPARARWATPALGAAVAVTAGTLALLGDTLPPALDPPAVVDDLGQPLLVGHPLVVAGQVLGVALYGVAAAAWARRAERESDEFLLWLAAACALSACARVNYALVPSLYSDWVHTGDLLRLSGYLLLLVGAQRELDSYFLEQRELGRLDERRRVARDLHDGLVQELAFISSQSRRLARGVRDERGTAADVARSAERATDEARRAIAALTRQRPLPAAEAVAEAAELVADRYGASVGLDLEPVAVTAEEQETLVRVAAEAVGNALRHGGVSEVQLRLRATPVRRLEVVDAGRGFDPALEREEEGRSGRHFGLVSMRERAERVGGSLRVSSVPGRGTTVEVRLP